jgi:hypothetical protein
MKTSRTALFALFLLGATAGAASAAVAAADIRVGPSGRASVDVGFFYDDLASYGNWVDRPSHGWVWTPRAVAASWRPYQDGHWVLTDQGWTWVSAEPYGSATYHYGRWYDDPEVGWSWVPGDEWAPSWVSWQEGGDYVGWAPLPPGVNVGVSLGSFGGGYAYGIAPASYCFVPERDFLAPGLATYIVAPGRIGPIFARTRNFTNYRFAGGRVFNNGIPVDRIQRFTGRVPRYQVSDLRYAKGQSWRQSRVEGNRLAFFRPQVQKGAHVAAPPERAAARHAVIGAAQLRAAHPNRVAAVQRQERAGVQQRQAVVARNERNERQEKAAQQRQAQGARQRERATEQRQTLVARQNERAAQQRQALVARQHEKATPTRQAQASRQQERFAQQRQAQASRQQERFAQQRQAQASRQQERRAQVHQTQQRQAAHLNQQRANAGGGPRPQHPPQTQGQQGERKHGRPPGQ